MRFQQYGELRGKALALICACLLWLMAACSGNPEQLVNNPTQPIHVQGTPTSDSSYYGQGVTIQLPRQLSTPGATATPGQGNPNPPSGQRGVPSAFPHYFSFGAMNPPGSASQLDDMRSRNGAAFSFRYQYLTGGVNTGRGWESWQQPSGQFATSLR